MKRFNVPIPPDDDFPQVICAQRRGEDFQTECVEYVPRWKVDGFMVVDKSVFFALADMAGGLERMLGNAEAENAKLRELGKQNELVIVDYRAEVAKLRELVNDMWRFIGTACKKYPRLFDPSAQGGQMVQLNMIEAFEQRMRELGLEVNS